MNARPAHLANPGDSTQRAKHVRVMTADILFRSDAGQPGQNKTMLIQPAAESTLRSFNRLLAVHDKVMAQESKKERTTSSITIGKKDEQLLEGVLKTQYENGKQCLHKLLHGDHGAFWMTSNGLSPAFKGNEMWPSQKTDQPTGAGPTEEEEGGTWYSVTKPAVKGVRQIVKGFPKAWKA